MVKRVPLDKEEIDAQRNAAMLGENGGRYRHGLEGGRAWGCGGLDRFSFEGGDVGSIYDLSTSGIVWCYRAVSD